MNGAQRMEPAYSNNESSYFKLRTFAYVCNRVLKAKQGAKPDQSLNPIAIQAGKRFTEVCGNSVKK